MNIIVIALVSLLPYVIDGDTLKINNVRHRLYCIDAPELSQNYGPESRQRLNSLISNQKLTIEVLGVDIYGRNISKITNETGIDVSKELVAEGLAHTYSLYCTDIEFNSLEDKAKKEGLNIWSQSIVIPPWVYRRSR
jgi:micrococcal nuclease